MISVIITVYNRESTVEAAIESCLSQTFRNYEIIIIDDGSQDSSRSKIERYVTRSENMKYFYQENMGAAAAKNRGVAEASGEYVVFLDSDDEFYGDSVLLKINNAIQSESCDFISFQNILINKVAKSYSESADIDSSQLSENIMKSPLNYPGKPPYTFRKSLFLSAGGFDESSRWGDALIFWRRFFSCNISSKVISDTGYIYNQYDSNSISRKRNEDYYILALDVMHRCYDENSNVIIRLKAEKNWQVIFMIYSLKSKRIPVIYKYTKLLISGRWYLLPVSLYYIFKTKVVK